MRFLFGLAMGAWIVLIAAAAIPNFNVRRGCGSPQRWCYANQKTIAGAIEMYNLDFNVDIRGITPRLQETLVRLGYIQAFPVDPGGGKGRYVMHQLSGNGIVCTEHGGIQSFDGGTWGDDDFDLLEADLTGLTLEDLENQRKALAELPPPPPPPAPRSWF
jgi:hypothetical protein